MRLLGQPGTHVLCRGLSPPGSGATSARHLQHHSHQSRGSGLPGAWHPHPEAPNSASGPCPGLSPAYLQTGRAQRPNAGTKRETALDALITEAGLVLGLPQPHPLGAWKGGVGWEAWLKPSPEARSCPPTGPWAQPGRPRGPKWVLLAQLGPSFCARSAVGQSRAWAPSRGAQQDTSSSFLKGSSSPGKLWEAGVQGCN